MPDTTKVPDFAAASRQIAGKRAPTAYSHKQRRSSSSAITLRVQNHRWHSHCYIPTKSSHTCAAGGSGLSMMTGHGLSTLRRQCGRATTPKRTGKGAWNREVPGAFFFAFKNLIGLGRDSI